jgi:anthranilate 1,2-dioxygenase small subunit
MARDVFRLIAQAQVQYARCIDDDRLEVWPDFFAERCVYKITTAENLREGLEAGIVFANSRDMLRDRVSALREANIYERQSYRHILGQPCILSDDGAEIRSETAFLILRTVQDGDSQIYATGRYRDVYAIGGDTVKLKERIVVCDSSRINTLLAIPL